MGITLELGGASVTTSQYRASMGRERGGGAADRREPGGHHRRVSAFIAGLTLRELSSRSNLPARPILVLRVPKEDLRWQDVRRCPSPSHPLPGRTAGGPNR